MLVCGCEAALRRSQIRAASVRQKKTDAGNAIPIAASKIYFQVIKGRVGKVSDGQPG